MLRRSTRLILIALSLAAAASALLADDLSADRRRQRAREFHRRAVERTGVLVPMYVYPTEVDKNPAYDRLMAAKRRYETVPMWVIVNPASGPGKKVDPNYTRAIARLGGAGCILLGYVTTSYAKRPAADVRRDIDTWLELYPKIHGIFFDEMIYEDNAAAAEYQAALNQYAHKSGCWPTVANPGADTPGRYFAAEAADVIVVHEGGAWPTEKRLKGDSIGGYSDYPPFTRAVLVHSTPKYDPEQVRMVRQHARWVYVTEGPYRPNDPRARNPWGVVSKHLEATCEQLQGK